MNNEIRKGATEYSLDCFPECGSVLVDYQRSKKAFENIARLEGWKRMGNIWVCQKCAQHPRAADGEERRR